MTPEKRLKERGEDSIAPVPVDLFVKESHFGMRNILKDPLNNMFFLSIHVYLLTT